jgi:type 1 glutamine amidotransferase
VRVLLSVDEASYQGGTMGADHPLAWCHAYGGGRCFYTALGHPAEAFGEPAFVRHLRGALEWLTD